MKQTSELHPAPYAADIANADSKLDAEMISRAAHSIAVGLSALLACARRPEHTSTRIDLPSVGAVLGPDTELTLSQIRFFAHCQRNYLWKNFEDGTLPSRRIGKKGAWVARLEDVQAWISLYRHQCEPPRSIEELMRFRINPHLYKIVRKTKKRP